MTRILWTRVSSAIAEIVEEVAGRKGITISEYIRQLIIADLDSRSIFKNVPIRPILDREFGGEKDDSSSH